MSVNADESQPQDRAVFGTRDLAARFDVSRDHVERVVGRLRLAHDVSNKRVVLAEDLERVELGLRAAGYLAPIREEVTVG